MCNAIPKRHSVADLLKPQLDGLRITRQAAALKGEHFGQLLVEALYHFFWDAELPETLGKGLVLHRHGVHHGKQFTELFLLPLGLAACYATLLSDFRLFLACLELGALAYVRVKIFLCHVVEK